LASGNDVLDLSRDRLHLQLLQFAALAKQID
jgi:hypothetical protein